MSDSSDKLEEKISELTIKRNKYEQKLRILSTLLEERKITAEDFKVLKFLYRDLIEDLRKKIELLFEEKSKRFGSAYAHPVEPK